ncbi:hypothetical protein ACTAZI_01575 [Legionella bozemanae]|uniref:hypothetical protein n=1 Tax=Legionella bozemanae TaxID=447 RepID=UPI003EF01234
MIKKFTLVTSYTLALISLMLLLTSCTSTMVKENSKNTKQHRQVFGGYHPHGHGHGHH